MTSMEITNLLYSTSDVTLVLLLASLAIFVWLAYQSKNVSTFQFQISIFIIIWVVGEIIQNRRLSSIVSSPEIGLIIHAVSMSFLTVMLWLRLYYSRRKGKRMIEDLDHTNENRK